MAAHDIQLKCETKRDDVFQMLNDLHDLEFMTEEIDEYKREMRDHWSWQRHLNETPIQIVNDFFKVCDR
jgi:hypothetical protein